MNRFLQLHLLTFHGPSNINRDDTGRPKTAIIGGVERLRISSQAIKRAVRTSDLFKRALENHLSQRSARTAEHDIVPRLIQDHGLSPEEAARIGRVTVAIFGKPDTEPGKELRARQLAFISSFEKAKLMDALKLILADPASKADLIEAAEEAGLEEGDDDEEPSSTKSGKKPKKQSKKTTALIKKLRSETLQKTDQAVDIAMFGRMLADAPGFNREAAVQVAHAFTTHKAVVESDFYTAMDDLKPAEEDVGAGFIGATGFGSGVYYTYVCIDTGTLVGNLADHTALARDGVKAFAEALATVTPSGKINSFANHGLPGFILAEAGDRQPRTLAGAFLKPVKGDDLMVASITTLEGYRDRMDAAFGPCAAGIKRMDVPRGEGSLAEIIAFLIDAMTDETDA